MIVVASVISATSMWFAIPAAHASTCAQELSQPCSVAATVICQVVAKGRPCLY
jgi:hypothetical protein